MGVKWTPKDFEYLLPSKLFGDIGTPYADLGAVRTNLLKIGSCTLLDTLIDLAEQTIWAIWI